MNILLTNECHNNWLDIFLQNKDNPLKQKVIYYDS